MKIPNPIVLCRHNMLSNLRRIGLSPKMIYTAEGIAGIRSISSGSPESRNLACMAVMQRNPKHIEPLPRMPVPKLINLVPKNVGILSYDASAASKQLATKTDKPVEGKKSPNLEGKPNADQLQHVFNVLEQTLPRIFVATLNYRIYSPQLLFIDNIRGKTYTGIQAYMKQVLLLKLVGHWKYAVVNMEIVNMYQVPNEGRITVRWRIRGISGLWVMLKFWKYKLWRWKELMASKETWHDGISHYDVGADGLVFRHIVDKVEEDTERVDNTRDKKIRLAEKLAGATAASTSCSVPLSIVITDGLHLL